MLSTSSGFSIQLKPYAVSCHHITHSDNGECRNHLCQDFNQKAPNLVWVSDITYIKAGGKWYYLCIVMDLFSRKIIAWHLSGKADTSLVITTFRQSRKPTRNEMLLMALCSTLTGVPNTPPVPSGSYWIH